MASSKNTAAVATYGDHEVIVPENKLRKAVSREPLDPSDDPIARAEQALAELAGEFNGWMESECERLDRARRTVALEGFSTEAKEALFHAAHDLKGQAATFGFPAVASAAWWIRSRHCARASGVSGSCSRSVAPAEPVLPRYTRRPPPGSSPSVTRPSATANW